MESVCSRAARSRMPLLRTETINGFVCKVYDNGIVKVGTSSDRFSMRLQPGDDDVKSRLEAELAKRERAGADKTTPSAAVRAFGSLIAANKPKTVLVGNVRREPAPRRQGECPALGTMRLESNLGRAWEIGQPLSRTEVEFEARRRACESEEAKEEAKKPKAKRQKHESSCCTACAPQLYKEAMELVKLNSQQYDQLKGVFKQVLSRS